MGTLKDTARLFSVALSHFRMVNIVVNFQAASFAIRNPFLSAMATTEWRLRMPTMLQRWTKILEITPWSSRETVVQALKQELCATETSARVCEAELRNAMNLHVFLAWTREPLPSKFQ